MRSEATLQHPGHGEIRSDRHRHRQPRRGGRGRRRRAVRGRRGQLQPGTQRTERPEDEVVAVAPEKASWRDIRRPSSAGFSKYHHQSEKTISTAPTITATRPADTPCDELALCRATVTAAMHSPSTIRVNSP